MMLSSFNKSAKQQKKTKSFSFPSNPTETTSESEAADADMPRELMVEAKPDNVFYADDVSSIQVGESVVGGDYATLPVGNSKNSKEELNMLFVVPEEPSVIVQSTPKRKNKATRAFVTPSPPKNKVINTTPSRIMATKKEQGSSSKKKKKPHEDAASQTTVHAANPKKHKLGISACVYVSLLATTTSDDDDDAEQTTTTTDSTTVMKANDDSNNKAAPIVKEMTDAKKTMAPTDAALSAITDVSCQSAAAVALTLQELLAIDEDNITEKHFQSLSGPKSKTVSGPASAAASSAAAITSTTATDKLKNKTAAPKKRDAVKETAAKANDGTKPAKEAANKVPVSQRIVQETLRAYVDWMLPAIEEKSAATKKKRSKKNKHKKHRLPVNVDDVSIVNDGDLEQVVKVATQCLQDGDYLQAIDVYMGLLAAQRKVANSEHDMATTLSGLTVMHLLQGDCPTAFKCAMESLKLYKETSTSSGNSAIQKQQEQVATSLAELGMVHFCSDNIQEALFAWRESLQLTCAQVGGGYRHHPHVALLLNNIGCAHYLQNQNYVSAMAALEESHAMSKGFVGNVVASESANTSLLQAATTLQNMGIVSAQRRQYESAISLFEQGLLVQESVVQNDDKHVALARKCLEQLQLEQQKKATSSPRTKKKERLLVVESLAGGSAQTLFGDMDGIPMRTSHHHDGGGGDDCVLLLGSLTNELNITQRVQACCCCCVVESQSSENGKAAPLELRKTRTSIPVDVDGDNNVMDAELHLQDIYLQATAHLNYGEIDEAMELFESVLRNHKDKYGDEHHLVGTAHHNMGIVHLHAANYDEALERFQQAVDIRTAALGPDHPDVSASLLKKGIVQLAQQDLDSAHVTFSQVLHLQRKIHGYRHALIAKVLNNIGCVHYELGGLLASLKAFEEALGVQRHLLEQHGKRSSDGDDKSVVSFHNVAIANTLCNVGFVLFKSEEYDRSIAVYQEALELQRRYLSPGHAAAEATMRNLAHVMATCKAIATRNRNAAMERLTEMYLDMLRCG